MVDLNNSVILRERVHPLLFPAQYNFVSYVEEEAKELLGHHITAVIAIFENNMRRIGFATKEDATIIEENLLQKILNDPKFIQNCEKEFFSYAEKLIDFCQKKKEKNPSKKELIAMLNIYAKLYMKTSYPIICHIFWSTNALRTLLEQKMKNIVKDEKTRADYIELLSTPTTPTYVFNEELELRRLVCTLNDDIKTVIQEEPYIELIEAIIKKEYYSIYCNLVEHSKNFGFIPYDYIGLDYWDVPAIITRVKMFLGQNNVEQQRRKMETHHQELEKKQNRIIKEVGLPFHLQRLFADLRRIAEIQDKRKMYCTMSHIFLNKYLLFHISKETEIPIELLRLMTVREIRCALNGKKFSLKELYERRKKAVIFISKERYDVYTGKDAEHVLSTLEQGSKDINEINGMVGSRGKAKGFVVVVMSAQEINKIKKGDILVAPTTTPDFVPAMQKAAAIVTNEGGITSHAAIVSRELGIPCIIGTKNATLLLKDGDYVEVDAESGVVRKYLLEKKENNNSK